MSELEHRVKFSSLKEHFLLLFVVFMWGNRTAVAQKVLQLPHSAQRGMPVRPIKSFKMPKMGRSENMVNQINLEVHKNAP